MKIVNLKLLREQTRYTGVFEGNEDHRVVQWFWEVLEERDNAGRAEFLKVCYPNVEELDLWLMFIFSIHFESNHSLLPHQLRYILWVHSTVCMGPHKVATHRR